MNWPDEDREWIIAYHSLRIVHRTAIRTHRRQQCDTGHLNWRRSSSQQSVKLSPTALGTLDSDTPHQTGKMVPDHIFVWQRLEIKSDGRLLS